MIGQDLLLKVVGTVLLAGALWAGLAWWEHRAEQRGYDRATAEWVQKEREISDAAEAKYAKRLADVLEINDQLNKELAGREADRLTKEKAHEKDVDAAVSRALAGAERLSIRTRPAACPAAGAGPGEPAAAAGPAQPEERADLVPEAAAEFIRIGAASARDVHDYNALLDEYHALRAACEK